MSRRITSVILPIATLFIRGVALSGASPSRPSQAQDAPSGRIERGLTSWIQPPPSLAVGEDPSAAPTRAAPLCPWCRLALAALGYALFLWAMAANASFSFGVRIQDERGRSVAAGGPYRWVRHPGYAGTVLAQAGIPLLLGSPWAFLPCALTALLFIVRTALEDRTLLAELPGYAEFAKHTRFRLAPGVW